MTTFYYGIRDVEGTHEQPIGKLMTIDAPKFAEVGVYRLRPRDSGHLELSLIKKWEYDMLDAVGVEVITLKQFCNLVMFYGVE